MNFVQQVNVLALHLNLDSPTQCSDVIEYIISVINKLVIWEEKVGSQVRNVELIKKLNDLSQSANAIITAPESSSDSDYCCPFCNEEH